MFQGFSKESGDFFWELLLHNERPWFMAHKAEFERLLKEPMQALAADTLSELGRLCPNREWRCHVSRIYRDARRLHGRGPYKEQLWFTLWDGAVEQDRPVFWFELNPGSYRFGMGCWATPAQMERWRQYVDANTAAVERLARRFREQDVFVLDGPLYSRPKLDRGPLLDPWVNCRSIDLACSRDFGGELFSAELPGKLAAHYASLMPYYDLIAHVYD